MGTSSSGSGPGKNSPLLPNWDIPLELPPTNLPSNNSEPDNSNPENSDPENPNLENSNLENQSTDNVQQVLTGNWGGVKSKLGRIANSKKGSHYSYKGLASQYVRNVGGVKNAVRSSRSGIKGGASLGGFLGSIGSIGLNDTLKNYGLSDYIGKTAEEIFAKISEKICPLGSTNEDAITRKAILDSLSSMYLRYEDNGNIVFDNLQEQDLELVFTEYISYYIYHKWLYELGLAIENKNITEKEAVSLEEEVKEFIFNEIEVEFKGKKIIEINFQSNEGQKIIEDIFEQSYTTLKS
jgi:hypothetical protein